MSISAIGGSSNFYSTSMINKLEQSQKLNTAPDMAEEAAKRREEQKKEEEKLSSGQKINSAADNAAGMAIAQKLLSSYNNLNVTNNNVSTEINRYNVADGALSSVQDSLGRMQELTLQSSNGIMTDADRSLINDELSYLKESISSIASDTEFNTKSLFDGTVGELSIESLGLSNFEGLDTASALDTLSTAQDFVSSLQSEVGASTNSLTAQFNNNAQTAQNTLDAYSELMDTDYSETITSQVTAAAMAQYQLVLQGNMLGTGSSFNMMM
ncbi:MAG: hypothetical protein ATN36_01715 [Epulopiscium sp. Nele67-Bin005]|nr:MAG: hypothetical protein ATN36_01715 [Epulopiscium sp. Nele67-Bin005]